MPIVGTQSAYVFLPYLVTSEKVEIGGIEFRPSNDLTSLSDVDRANVAEMSMMFFLKNECQISVVTFAVLPIIDQARRLPDIEKLRRVRNCLGLIFAQPHKSSNSLLFSSDHTAMVVLSTGPQSIHLIEPDHNTKVVSDAVTRNFSGGEIVQGVSGLFDFSYHFWAVPGARIYPNSPEMYFNYGQNLTTDLLTLTRNNRFDYKLLFELLLSDDVSDFSLRVFESLNWFNEATRNPEKESLSVASLAIAIETLLGIRAAEKTERITDAIALLLGRPDRLEEWVRQFYRERSAIVHEGKPISLLFNLSENKQQPEYFGSMYLYGIKIYQLCLGAILAGNKLATEERLSEHFFSNQECYQQIIKLARDKDISSHEREKEITRLVGTVRWNSSVPGSALKYETLLASIEALATLLLEENLDVRPVSTDLLKSFVELNRAKRELETLEVLNSIAQIARSAGPRPPKLGDSFLELVDEVWLKVSGTYIWLKFEKT